MSLRSKQHLVYAGLLVLTFWPLAHVYLAKRYDVSPWKLAGWGMYTTPRLDWSGIRVFARSEGSESFQYLEALPPALHDEAGVFLERYRWLRQLVRPDALARSILALEWRFEELKIVVYQPALDRPTGMIVSTEVVYEYQR